jgi:hypothetical protein
MTPLALGSAWLVVCSLPFLVFSPSCPIFQWGINAQKHQSIAEGDVKYLPIFAQLYFL